jgi:hypothetical protein
MRDSSIVSFKNELPNWRKSKVNVLNCWRNEKVLSLRAINCLNNSRS